MLFAPKSWHGIMWMAFSSDTFNLDVPRPWRNGYRTVNERIDILSTATVLEMEVKWISYWMNGNYSQIGLRH